MTAAGDTLLEVSDLQRYFTSTHGVGPRRTTDVLRAVDGVSFRIPRGSVFALVGETGCGKSTTGKMIAGYLSPSSGTISVNGEPVPTRELRRSVQLVSQDPFSSLNPRHTIGTILAAPFLYQGTKNKADARKAVVTLLQRVGLSPDDRHRFPAEFSGGQRQRIAIARAIALEPPLIVADEPVSALDVSIRAQIVNLLEDLRQQLNTTYLFISHDLSVVRHLADQIAVMYLGKIVEVAPRDALYSNPRHPYTKALVSAAPIPDPRVKARAKIELSGEVPSPLNPPAGCRFHTRCWKAQELCSAVEPLLEADAAGHGVACHFPEGTAAPVLPPLVQQV
jgi:peptide/nickel transport system ATP-binding protein/oligopeptide transport system ATP-binding protein